MFPKTVCTLHKQNFDLKLELYHRRERQDALEEKVQRLEAENAEIRGMREKFDEDMAKRDKAVNEAVDIIVRLEAKVDDLLREKEMVRQVESNGSYCHSRSDQSEHLDDDGAPLTPKMKGLEFFGMMDGAKSLERVPSFLSERSEQTENLRNVVMGGLQSLSHMRTVSGSSFAPSDINRIASPSLSVLSESSFVSVYGSKNEHSELSTGLDTELTGANNTHLDGRLSTPAREDSNQEEMNQTSPPSSWTPKGPPPASASFSTHIQFPNNVIATTSPLQKLEMLEKQLPSRADMPRSSTFGQPRSMPNSSPARSTRPAHATTRQEKRNSVQRIVTNGTTNKELANAHVLPPTPDTVASSTLRKHKNLTSSQDSLQEGSLPTRQERSDTFGLNNSYQPSPKMRDIPDQRASITAFTGRVNLPMPPINTDLLPQINHHASLGLPPRPRSADETTISRHRANSWISDSDSDGGVDAHSEESTFDYWMRESIRPNAHHDVSSQMKGERKPSPDLFSFPTDSKGWGTDAIFGAMRGHAFLGSPAPGLKRERIDDMTTSLGETSETMAFDPQEMGYAPPTPDRRSSLHARTGSSNKVPSVAGKPKKTPAQNSSANKAMNTKGRSNSIDSAKVHFTPEAPPSTGRRNQYPPLSGQGMRRSLGFNNIFRRSGSESQGSSTAPASATEATFPSNAVPLPPHVMSNFSTRTSGRSSVPPPPTMPWALRPPPGVGVGVGLQEDDLHSATPPPILRNRGLSQPPGPEPADSSFTEQQQQQQQQQQGVASLPGHLEETGAAPTSSSPVGAAQNPGKRRWLNLSRMSNSLKNRSGNGQ